MPRAQLVNTSLCLVSCDVCGSDVVWGCGPQPVLTSFACMGCCLLFLLCLTCRGGVDARAVDTHVQLTMKGQVKVATRWATKQGIEAVHRGMKQTSLRRTTGCRKHRKHDSSRPLSLPKGCCAPVVNIQASITQAVGMHVDSTGSGPNRLKTTTSSRCCERLAHRLVMPPVLTLARRAAAVACDAAPAAEAATAVNQGRL